jgi:SAM-dependent methyltransferase
MDHFYCSICSSRLDEPLYRSLSGKSLTSLCRIHPATTVVRICHDCGHLQTEVIADIDMYYDTQYDILVESVEEDQIYQVLDGKPIYRTEHQVKTILEKIDIGKHVDLLDYGCAKSSTVRALCSVSEKVTPHLFDVSARYIPFWETFVHPDNWAVNETKPEWNSRFDIVTSFFTLEHIPAVAQTMRDIVDLLKPGGVFYCIVPNVFSNSADFIVIDHCNHFTQTSLQRLLANAGLEVQRIDEHAHRGAFVIVATKPLGKTSALPDVSLADVEKTCANLSRVGYFWNEAASGIRNYEAGLNEEDKIAIYGAGFYGTFISASLLRRSRISCYLDQNPYLQGKECNSRPVLAPSELPEDVKTIFVGLNPAHASAIISDIPALARRKLNYFYL